MAAKNMPMSHLIMGVDLVPIKPIPGVITFTADITTDQCRSALRKELKDWKADVVLHDGAPNVGSAWLQDAYSQAELVLMSLKLATEMLRPGGTFVTKVFRSKDYNALMWVFTQLFKKVEATKPASSRSVSAEIFVVCQDFLAPKKIDPKFLDPKCVFQEVELPVKPLNIFRPEKRTRQRDGYEEGVTMLFKAASVNDFLMSDDPVAFLGTYSQIQFPKVVPQEEPDYVTSPLTTQEIKEYCDDLKLLGKREFKALLKWRLSLKKEFKVVSPAEREKQQEKEHQAQFKNIVEENPLSDSEQIDLLLEKEDKKTRKLKKKALLKKAKERLRMKLGMQVEANSADPEYGVSMDQELFSLDKNYQASTMQEVEGENSGSIDHNSDAKKSIKNLNVSMLTKEEALKEDSQKAALLFSRPIFQAFKDDLAVSEEDDDGEDSLSSEDEELVYDDDSDPLEFEDNPVVEIKAKKANSTNMLPKPVYASEDDEMDPLPSGARASSRKTKSNEKKTARKRKYDSDNNSDIEFVKPANEKDEEEKEEFSEADKMKLLTPEGMTMALEMRKGASAKKALIDNSFSRYAFDDYEGLPSWFKDDEVQHSKAQIPVTKEAMDALRAKMKTLSSKPIKKALEAKLRRKGKMLKRLEAIKNKAGLVNENEELSEAQKSGAIQKMLRNATKGMQRKRPTLVVAKGFNKGVKSRPKGVKGRYKMVDPRMKKELRASKRIEKRDKKRRR